MFFIMGISQGRKAIEYVKTVICSRCGRYGRYEVYMTYSFFSLFFIPLFRWDRHYYVEMTCCHALYELDGEVGRRLLRGEKPDITEGDLTYAGSPRGGFSGWSNPQAREGKRCPDCGYEMQEDFEYCPKCGKKM